MSHEIGMLRSPRLFMVPKAIPPTAREASRRRAAGVEEQITCTRMPGEPGKPCRFLRRVTGGADDRGTTGGVGSGAAGWRIGA